MSFEGRQSKARLLADISLCLSNVSCELEEIRNQLQILACVQAIPFTKGFVRAKLVEAIESWAIEHYGTPARAEEAAPEDAVVL